MGKNERGELEESVMFGGETDRSRSKEKLKPF